jgi:hypothetical protein
MDVHSDECKWIVVVGRIMWMNVIQYLDENGWKINVGECHSISWMKLYNVDENRETNDGNMVENR